MSKPYTPGAVWDENPLPLFDKTTGKQIGVTTLPDTPQNRKIFGWPPA